VNEPDRVLVAFVDALRRAGLSEPVGATLAFVDAVGVLERASRSSLYWAGRATLVRRPEDIATYDRAFDAFWRAVPVSPGVVATETVRVVLDDDQLDDPDDVDAGDEHEAPADRVLTVRFSPHEVLRTKDFAAYDAAELAEARRVMAELRLSGARRRSRRRHSSSRRRGDPDLRRTVREALRTQGDAVRLRHLRAHERPRRVVLLCDVSGSMEPYSRALLRFANAAVAGRARVEAFTLGTRLTRLTRELSSRDPDVALEAAADAVPDWSGGTRLGEGLRRFNDQWGVRGMARGAVVVILSDGWDRGDPAELAEQMARLSRVAHRIVWVNPLKASPDYEPLARGMAAALPYVDDFVEGHSLASLEELAEIIRADEPRTRRTVTT
jgi:uncharacterized protein with von Willebrand factor type A (vWA) domain